jgi:hypothetical protein
MRVQLKTLVVLSTSEHNTHDFAAGKVFRRPVP